MDSDLTAAQSLITTAMRALKEGDRRAARRAAEQAAALAPQIEQSWLILAYLSGPKAAQFYLEQALRANPASPKVLTALEWLKNQPTSSAPPSPVQPAGSESPDDRLLQPCRLHSNLSKSEFPPAPIDRPKPLGRNYLPCRHLCNPAHHKTRPLPGQNRPHPNPACAKKSCATLPGW